MAFPVVIHSRYGGEQYNPNTQGVSSGGYAAGNITDVSPRWPLGTKMVDQYGRAWRFALKSAADSVAGNLQQAAANTTNHLGCAIQTAVVAADRSIKITLGATAVTQNEYLDGFLLMEATSGNGYAFLIDQHASVLSGGTFTVPLAPGYAAQVAATTSGTASLIHNRFRSVLVMPTSPTQEPAGVSPRIITASRYGWLQTGGPCACTTEGTLVLGNNAVPSGSAAGAVAPNAAATSINVGRVMRVAATTATSLVDLMLED